LHANPTNVLGSEPSISSLQQKQYQCKLDFPIKAEESHANIMCVSNSLDPSPPDRPLWLAWAPLLRLGEGNQRYSPSTAPGPPPQPPKLLPVGVPIPAQCRWGRPEAKQLVLVGPLPPGGPRLFPLFARRRRGRGQQILDPRFLVAPPVIHLHWGLDATVDAGLLG
jgi:hypothetical protein